MIRSSAPVRGALIAALALLLPPAPAAAEASQAQALPERMEALREEVVDLERELFLLEEELLFPANTQVTVFLSMDVGEFFALDSVELRVDDELVTSWLYTEREVDALVRGAVQRLWLGNLRTGEHEIVAVFVGRGPSGREYRRATFHPFEKGIGARYLELAISDSEAAQQPEFLVREWD